MCELLLHMPCEAFGEKPGSSRPWLIVLEAVLDNFVHSLHQSDIAWACGWRTSIGVLVAEVSYLCFIVFDFLNNILFEFFI